MTATGRRPTWPPIVNAATVEADLALGDPSVRTYDPFVSTTGTRPSHVAIGVSDMARSLPFYRDVLGFNVVIDYYQGWDPNLYGDREPGSRHTVLLRVGEFEDNFFLALSEQEGQVRGTPLEFDAVGIHHFAVWVRDLDPYLARLGAADVQFHMPARTATGKSMLGWALPPWLSVRSCIFQDPDGTYIQLEEILPGEIPAEFSNRSGHGWTEPAEG